MTSESLPASADDFFRIAEELVMLTRDEALIVAEAVKSTGHSPEQIALQKGFLNAAQVDIIETLLHPCDTVPGYEILDVLGQGGMGVVYRARQLNLNRIVALKTILLSRMSDKSAAGRFEQEAKTVGKLRHPNIVAAYDFGRHEGRLFLAMELVEGEDVDSLLQDEGRLDEATAWGIARQAAAGLAHANRLGVVHRDIKPANLLLVEPPEGFPLPYGLPMVKIADFGLAFLADEQQARTRLTSDNSAVGSPHYMAPEQLTDMNVDFRADIYALGATVYHMLAGRPPFGGLNLSQIIAQKLSGEIKRLSERCPDVSPESCRLVERMLARDPQDRPGDYRTLIADIELIAAASHSTSSLLPAATAAGVEERITDVVSRQDTVIVRTGEASAGGETPETTTHRRLLFAGGLILLLAIGLGIWTALPAPERPVRPVGMVAAGADIPLFYGTNLRDWINDHGNWILSHDEEQANVIAGSSGEAVRKLPAKRGPDGRPIPMDYYRLTLVINPHQAIAVEVRFGFEPDAASDRTHYVLRFDEKGVLLGERGGVRGDLRPVSDPLPLGEFAARHSVQIDCQPTGWFVTVDQRELPGVPRRPRGELPEFRLAVENGPAWFSDVFVEELRPVETGSTP